MGRQHVAQRHRCASIRLTRNVRAEVALVWCVILGSPAPLPNLAEDLQDRGDYLGAEDLHAKLLASKLETLGEAHPSTLVTVNNLAVAHERLGKHGEADSLHKRTRRLRMDSLCHLHPHTLDSINNLAVLNEKQGRYSAAERQNREALSLGLQGGQGLITTLQFNQTWAKIPGRTKKHVIPGGNGMVIHD